MSEDKKKSIKKDKKNVSEKSAPKKSSSKPKTKKLTNTDAKKYEDIHFVDSTKPVWNYSLFSEEDITNLIKYFKSIGKK